MHAVPRTPPTNRIPKHWLYLMAGVLLTLVVLAGVVMAIGYECANRTLTLRCFN